jgi:membrane protease YdiL (CAAX protease family)
MTSQIQPCTREQILNGMGITTLFSALIVGLWIWLGSSFPVPFRWDPLALAWGAGLGLGVALLSGGVYRLWPAYRRAATAYLHWVADPLQWGDILWVGLLPGWSEEWLFRGVLLSALVASPLGWTGGILLSGLLFGALHWLGWQGWPYAVWASGVGILMGIGLWLSGNLLVTIVAHTLVNWIGVCTWKCFFSQAEP